MTPKKDKELDEAVNTIELEEGPVDGEGRGFVRPVYESTDQHKLVLRFLEKYGIDTSEMAPETAVEKYNKIVNLVNEQVQVLSKGAVNDALDRGLSLLPDGMRGEYFLNNPEETSRARAMGWVPFEPDVEVESLTGKSDGLFHVGDLVLYMRSEETYAAMLIARERRHAERRARRKRLTEQPSQGGVGTDPLGELEGRIMGAHPDVPLRTIEQLGG
jgi:hypothetical protein